MKDANKAILNDEGQPDVMQSMHRDFLRMLQGALVVRDYDFSAAECHNDGGDSDALAPSDRIRVKSSHGYEVYISLKDYVKKKLESEHLQSQKKSIEVGDLEEKGKDQSDGGGSQLVLNDSEGGGGVGSESVKPIGKLIPDLDFEKVMLNK